MPTSNPTPPTSTSAELGVASTKTPLNIEIINAAAPFPSSICAVAQCGSTPQMRMADSACKSICSVVRPWIVIELQQAPHHKDDLIFVCGPCSHDCLLDLHRGIFTDLNAAQSAGNEGSPPGVSRRNRRAHVRSKVNTLDSCFSRAIAINHTMQLVRDTAQASGKIVSSGRLNTAIGSATNLALAFFYDAPSGIGQTWIDTQDDHIHLRSYSNICSTIS